MEDKVIYEILTKGKVNDFGKAENVWFTSDTHFGHSKIIEFCDLRICLLHMLITPRNGIVDTVLFSGLGLRNVPRLLRCRKPLHKSFRFAAFFRGEDPFFAQCFRPWS